MELMLIWLGYFIFRISTHPKVKANPKADILTGRVSGIITFLVGGILLASRFEWLSKTILIKWSQWIIVLIICSFILASYFDKKRGAVFDFDLKQEEPMFSLMTWDMWLITAIGIFFLIYYPLSIHLNIG